MAMVINTGLILIAALFMAGMVLGIVIGSQSGLNRRNPLQRALKWKGPLLLYLRPDKSMTLMPVTQTQLGRWTAKLIDVQVDPDSVYWFYGHPTAIVQSNLITTISPTVAKYVLAFKDKKELKTAEDLKVALGRLTSRIAELRDEVTYAEQIKNKEKTIDQLAQELTQTIAIPDERIKKMKILRERLESWVANYDKLKNELAEAEEANNIIRSVNINGKSLIDDKGNLTYVEVLKFSDLEKVIPSSASVTDFYIALQHARMAGAIENQGLDEAKLIRWIFILMLPLMIGLGAYALLQALHSHIIYTFYTLLGGML